MLVNKGARLDLQGNKGATPLILASYHGHTEIAELLIEKGARSDIKDGNGLKAIDYAKKYQHNDLLKLFR